jgi:hypothetical protein
MSLCRVRDRFSVFSFQGIRTVACPWAFLHRLGVCISMYSFRFGELIIPFQHIAWMYIFYFLRT